MRYKFEDIAINSIAKKKPTEADKDTYIGLEHLDPGTFVVSRYGAEVAPKGEKLLMKKGDVLFGKRRAYQKKVAIAPFDGIFSAHGMVLRPKEDVVDSAFFPFFISSDYFLDTAINISVGSLSPTINWGTLKLLEFDLPPLEEQRKLAELLWAANATREAYEKLIVATDKIVKAQFDEILGDPVKNPMDWDCIRLGELTDIGSSKRIFANEYIKSGVPFYRTKEIVELSQGKQIETPLFISPDRYQSIVDEFGKPENGDLLISAVGTIGVIWVVSGNNPFYFKDGNLILVKKCNKVESIFFKMSLERIIKGLLNDLSGGSSYDALTIVKLKQVQFPLPPIDLQHRFAEFVYQSEAAKCCLKDSLAELEATYKALLSESLG